MSSSDAFGIRQHPLEVSLRLTQYRVRPQENFELNQFGILQQAEYEVHLAPSRDQPQAHFNSTQSGLSKTLERKNYF